MNYITTATTSFLIFFVCSCSSDDLDANGLNKPMEKSDASRDFASDVDQNAKMDMAKQPVDLSKEIDISDEGIDMNMKRDMFQPDMLSETVGCPAMSSWTERPNQNNGIPEFDTFGECEDFITHSSAVLQNRASWLTFTDPNSWQVSREWVNATVLDVTETSATLKVEDTGLTHRLNWRGPKLSKWLALNDKVEVKRDNEYYGISSHIRTNDAELIAWVVDSNQPTDSTLNRLNRLDPDGERKWRAICGIEQGKGAVYGLEISKNGTQTSILPGQTMVLGHTVITLLEAAYHNNSDFNGEKRYRALISLIRVSEGCASKK